MKRNESKSVLSVIAAAVAVLMVAGCASVPSAELAAADDFLADMPVDRGTGTE